MSSVAKIAISLPPDVLKEVDKIRRKQQRSRSAFITEVLQFWLQESHRSTKDDRYVSGYLKMPEGDVSAIASAAMSAWEPWE